ncbi:MAG TPA: hypothetical protein VFN61_12710 [Acidimicrobiales bacterium]|nr:hypothetical protein [Acidimicrobiales bacterium]
MGVREDCRHYLKRSTAAGEAMERCRVGAGEEHPFACPDGCLFFEERVFSRAGWAAPTAEPMSNTSLGLSALPPPRPKPAPAPRTGQTPSKKKGRKGR